MIDEGGSTCLEAALQLVKARTGLAFCAARRSSAERSLVEYMERYGVEDPKAYNEVLSENRDTFDQLVDELVVGETYFFREPEQFQAIERSVLPEIWQRRGSAQSLRAWSAGCSSGEEPYSLGILLAQMGYENRFRILATDISHRALAKAHKAAYGEWSLRRAERPRLSNFFARVDGSYVLDPRIRKSVCFRYHNLALDTYPCLATGTWALDVILCRNVLIYFDEETVGTVARRLCESLAEEGWLVTGSSDPSLSDHTELEPVTVEGIVLYQRRPRRVHPKPTLMNEPEPALLRTDAAVTAVSGSVTSARGDGETPSAGVVATTPQGAPLPDPLAEAQEAFARGFSTRVVSLGSVLSRDEEGCVLLARALADLGQMEAAERVVSSALSSYRLSAELHFLHAVILMDLGRDDEAEQALRRTLYLEPSLAVAHLILGTLLRRRDDLQRSLRSLENAASLLRSRPPAEVVPLSDGGSTKQLLEAVEGQIALLETLEAEP